MLIRFIFALLSSSLIMSCMPAPYGSYYRPAYPDNNATLSREDCHGQAGPMSKLSFTLANNISISVSAKKNYLQRERSDTPLTIDITLPPGESIRFLSDQITFTTFANSEHRVMPMHMRVLGRMYINSDTTIDLDKIGPVSASVAYEAHKTHPDWPLVDAEIHEWNGISNFHPRTLIAHFPAIEIDDRKVSAKPEVFTASGGPDAWWYYETEQHRQEREQKFNRCMEDTPQLNCRNILEIIQEGTNQKQGDIEYRARLWKTDTPDLRYVLNLLSYSEAALRFLDNKTVFEDHHGGKKQAHQFDTVYLVIGWLELPLSTEIRGITHGNNASTLLRIEGSLGDKMESTIHIHLPALLINGERYELAPIELELRRFDGGMEPFNC